MRSKLIYILLIITTISMVGLMAWLTIRFRLGYYIIGVEVLAVIATTLIIMLYQQTIKPLHSIISGIDLLNAQDFSSRLRHVKQREIDQIIDIFNKMLNQLKSERLKVREKNEQLDVLINASPMGVIILDTEDNISLINPAALTILECQSTPQKIGETGSLLTTELLSLERDSSKMVHLNDGNIFKCTHSSFLSSGYNHSFYLIERMTEELLRAERKAYEKVIRVIAHEVGNTMTGVSSTLELARDVIELSADRELTNILLTSSQRCISLSQFISKYAEVVKIPEPMMCNIEINSFLENNSKLFESLAMGRNTTVRYKLCNSPIESRGDLSQLEQAMINIIKNAIEAIKDEGIVEVSTTATPPTITVSNNGAPISQQEEQHLFTPFYTTKPEGHGIGLMVIREVLTNHGYRFSLSTDKNNKTNFTIYL